MTRRNGLVQIDVALGPTENNSAVVRVRVWCWADGKPYSEQMFIQMHDAVRRRFSTLRPGQNGRNCADNVLKCIFLKNKANLRDLIAATGLVISNWIQIVKFSARVTLKYNGWPCKTIGHLFYTTSSCVHHFKSIGEFKLDLQSRNAQFGSKLVICYPVWPWNLMDDLGKQ